MSELTPERIRQQLDDFAPWFYDFDLGPHGRTVSFLPPETAVIHDTRLEMVNRLVKGHFGERMKDIRCADIGCHEGYYSLAMARQGVAEVCGMDVRGRSLEKARFIGELMGLENLSFQEQNCEEPFPAARGEFELTLFLGVLYHLENPMRALRNLRAITKELCVIETQVIEEIEGQTEWGSRACIYPYSGVLAFIDETEAYNAKNNTTGATPLVMCPSLKALKNMLHHAGFARVEKVEPAPGAYEQHARGRRVVYAAYV